ncbi:MAG: hypothetical protein ACTHOD_09805 [Motilibacteraceae bacterium]
MPRQRRGVLAVLASLVLAACASGSTPPADTCGHVMGSSDGGVLAGLGWQPGGHPLGAPAPVYACVHVGPHDRVRLAVTGTARVHVLPDPARVDRETERVPLQLVVDRPGDAVLRLIVVDGANDRPRIDGPDVARVTATASGWQLLVPPPS